MPPRRLLTLARSLLREPLVSFVLLGVLVFGVDHALRRDVQTIRITPTVRDEIARSLQVRLGRAPEDGELRAELDGWKEKQALYREGRKMGLLDDDPIVQARIATKVLQVARDRDVLPEATEAELRDFFERHKPQYTLPPTFDFDVVFIAQGQDDAQRGDRVLSQLRAGASPDDAGDWFPRGHRFVGEGSSDVAQVFGVQAAKELPGYALGDWHLVAGPRGLYVIRVTKVDRGEPDFEQLRAPLKLAFDAERRDNAAQAFARQIEAHYRFVDSE